MSQSLPAGLSLTFVVHTAVAHRLLRFLAFVVLASLCVGANAARTRADSVSAEDWQRIRLVINAQRDAMVAGDGERAAAFATPLVRRQFGSGQRFLRMVEDSYAPLLRARYTEFLEGTVLDGMVVQPLRLVLPDDTVVVALYSLERQRDGRWRVAGCLLAPSTVSST